MTVDSPGRKERQSFMVNADIFEPYDPDQDYLFPPSPRDWVPEGHLAHFISDTVDQLDLSPLFAKYEGRENGRGQKAYHPRMLLKVLLYSYCTGIFSSRKIATAMQDLVPLRLLAAGNEPGHRTIARFRQENIAEFRSLFVQVVQIAQTAGLVSLGTLAVDGTKIKANASRHKAMSYGRMKEARKKLRREIRKITELAKRTDTAEDVEFGPDFRGDQLPEEMTRRKDRLVKIKAAIERLETEQAEADALSGRRENDDESRRGRKPKRPNGVPPDKKQSNFTDPESRLMKTSSGGFDQCFNGQIAVDADNLIIVAAELTQCAADAGELVRMKDAAESNTKEKTKRLLADAGYKSEANLQALEDAGIDAYVALGRKERLPKDVAPDKPATRRMARKVRTKRGRTRYKKRKAIAELPFGWIKNVLGFRQFSLRGFDKVDGEWSLVCLATNLRRMSRQMAWS